MKKVKAAAAIAVFLAASILTGCGPRSSMSTLSVEADSEASSIFSLTKVLDLGTNYLVSLDYENAILQYVEIIEHDPKNKEAYAGLYAAYAALGKTDEAKDVFSQAQKEFKDEADFLPQFLEDAKLVYKNGGGNDPFRMLSEQYWENVNSDFAEDVGKAWLEAEPSSADGYALLCAHYAGTGEDEKLQAVLADAEENGISFDKIDTEIKVNSDGTTTLTMQMDDGSGKGSKTTVKVDIAPGDDAKTVTGEIAGKAADNAASKVVEESGLTGEAASIANSMAQEALRKGLKAAGTAPTAPSSSSSKAPTTSASSSTATTTAPAQTGDGSSDDFDWSEMEKDMKELDPDFSF